MLQLILRFAVDKSGATAIEYSLLASLMTVVIIAALHSMGTVTASKFNAVAGNLR